MIYDGFDFRSLGYLRVENINRPVVSEIGTQTNKYAGREGSVFGSSSREEKIIEVTIRLIRPYEEIAGLNAGFELARRELASKLYRTQPCKLILHDAPDVYEMAVLTGSTEIEQEVYTRAILLTFVCTSPSSWGELTTKASTGGKIECLIGGNDVTQPWVVVDASGPFIIKFDDNDFEITQSVTGDVFIDARYRDDEPSGHHVFTEDNQTVQYSIFSDWPEWEPGIHAVECERPFAISWRERWR